MRALWWTALPTLVVIAGCASQGAGNPNRPGAAASAPQQRCDNTAAQWAVGKTNTVQHVEDARRRSGALMARVLRANQPTTQEFNAERLNLVVDATGRILTASCG